MIEFNEELQAEDLNNAELVAFGVAVEKWIEVLDMLIGDL